MRDVVIARAHHDLSGGVHKEERDRLAGVFDPFHLLDDLRLFIEERIRLFFVAGQYTVQADPLDPAERVALVAGVIDKDRDAQLLDLLFDVR